MSLSKTTLKKITLLIMVSWCSVSMSGCTTFWHLFMVSVNIGRFNGTTPLIPVTPYWSQKIEDRYHEEEYYRKVPILDPVEGENAPIFCLDPPTPDHVMRTLPDDTSGGVWFIAETHRNNVRMVIDPIVDKLDECRFYPMVGPARMHHCHYKCTVYFEKTIRSSWPIPFTHTDRVEEVVYIDKDHLIRCSGGVSQ